MKTVVEKAKLIDQCLSKQTIHAEKVYRRLTYCHTVERDGALLLYNILTKQLVVLSDEERAIFLSEEITPNDLSAELIENWMLVPQEFDDRKLHDQVRSFVQLFQPTQMSSYDVFVTTDCNARCFYCFELDSNHFPMTDEVAGDLADYIIKNTVDRTKRVHLRWFGGEPLYNLGAIDLICEKLEKAEIKYYSTMVSNGYLFDEEILNKAKGLWRLTSVQITLDGTQQIYNRVKNYIYEDKNPYKRVLNNIADLLANEIQVVVRLNLDAHNKDDLHKLVDELSDRYGKNKYLHVYSHLLFENVGHNNKKVRSDDQHAHMSDEFSKLEEYIRNKWFKRVRPLPRKFELNGCMAAIATTVTVAPDGRLGKCEHYFEEKMFGSIYSDKVEQEYIDMWKIPRNSFKECENCTFYPLCFVPKECPGFGQRKCDGYARQEKLKGLESSIVYEYKKHKKETEDESIIQ